MKTEEEIEKMSKTWVDINKLGDRSAYEKAFKDGFKAGRNEMLEIYSKDFDIWWKNKTDIEKLNQQLEEKSKPY